MRPALQAWISLFALGGLMVPIAHSQTTAISELPLKAAALAKPNVIFGMDDSGSMDLETMLDTTEGFLWMDTSTAPPTSWTATGTPVRDLGSGAFGHKYGYLFPVGISAGAQSAGCNNHNFTAVTGGSRYGYCNPQGGFGMVAPPIPQLAAARSARYNALYYNPMVTYRPWSPAYLDDALRTYANARPTAALAHPRFTNSATLNLATTIGANTAIGYHFYAHPGHRLPVGTRICNNTAVPCTNWTDAITAEYTLTTQNGSRFVAIPYYPATYWHFETCTANDNSAASTCVSAPGGGTLRRYEIRDGNTFPSNRTYAEELQNFANWWQYYRKRVLSLAGSMGTVLENMNGLRMGVVNFNNRQAVTMFDADATGAANNRLAVAGRFYTNPASSATPTRETLNFIGQQFHTNTDIIQFACQRNSAFIVTDGFANASDPAVVPPAYSQSTWGNGAPYAETTSNSLADISLSYYTTRLRGEAFTTGRVPLPRQDVQNPDANRDLHMNTYAIMMGIRGTLWPGITDAWAQPITWPIVTASGDRRAIDDLWHATINGRGQMYLATSPEETSRSIQDGLNDILNFPGAQSSVTVSSVNLASSDGFAYMARYTPARWAGDLTANAINSATGEISASATWSAATILGARAFGTRQIVASNGSTGVPFLSSSASIVDLVNPGDAWGTDDALFAYLRGDRSQEGTVFRSRTSLLGAVINAEPLFDREQGVVYVASGEGMLHAFDTRAGADRGRELWAFVPQPVLADIGQTASRSYSFKTQLDGSPAIGKVSDTARLLVAGMGASGRHYYAVDVTNPRANTEANAANWVRWTFPAPGDTTYAARVGQTLGKPLIVSTAAGYRVVVTSGYNPSDRIGRLFVLNPATGAVEKEFATAASATSDMGLAHVSGFLESSGLVRYVYGGDLQGNLWRFDLDAASGTAPALVATLRGPGDAVQPVTAPPDLTLMGNRRVVLVGTGRMLDIEDWGNGATQSFYAIADGSTLTDPRGSLVAQVYSRSSDTITASNVDWETQRGWYMDLPAGEQANTRPSVAHGAVAFTTNRAGRSDCSASSWLYVVDIRTGGRSSAVSYVSTQVSATENASAVTVVSTTSNNLKGLTQTSDGRGGVRDVGSSTTVNPSKNTWREVRRR